MKKKYHKLSDEELAGLFSKDKEIAEQAFNVLYYRYHIRVYSFFLRKLKNKTEAEDKHQETFEKFYKSIIEGKSVNCVEAFLFTIAKNIAVNHEISRYFGRKKVGDKYIGGQRKYISLDDISGLENLLVENHTSSVEVKELIELIKLAIDRLEDKYKDPFIDRKTMEMSINEIADKYGLSYEGAKKRVDRAMIKIKDILKPYIDDINSINN